MLRQRVITLIRNELGNAKYMCTSVEHATSKDSRDQKVAYMKHLASQTDTDEKPAGWDTAKPYHEIPGPKPVPVFGNIWRFLPVVGTYYGLDQIAQHERFNRDFGNIVKLSDIKLREDLIILFDPDDIEFSYRNEGVWPYRTGLESLVYYRLNVREDIFQGQGGVLTGQGIDWYNTRSVVNPPMMQPRSAQHYINIMDEVAHDFTERIRYLSSKHPQKLMPENFSNELNKWALESICVVGLNKRLGLLEPNLTPESEGQKFINDVMDLFLLLNELDVKPSLWKWMSTPMWRKHVKTLDRITAFEMKYIEEAIDKMNDPDKPKTEDQLSILERLLKKDKKIAFAMVFDMLVAGIDTTSRTTAAALYFLSKNKEAQDKLREEACRMLPKPDTPITKAILNDMPYLKAVIKETTRLAPIAIGNVRRTQKEIVLSGYQIPKGVDLIHSHMFLCRQEKYFTQANQFIPDRWLRHGGEKYAAKDSHPFVFMPFGFGPRSCIGRRLAQLEMEVVLAKMIRNFEVSWPHEDMKWVMNMLYGVGSPLKYKMTPLE